MLRLLVGHIDVGLLKQMLNNGPVSSSGACTSERVEEDQGLARLRITLVTENFVIECP